MYKLGCYKNNGEPEVLRTVKTREEAREEYKILKKNYNCTIWIQKIEFVNPKDLQTGTAKLGQHTWNPHLSKKKGKPIITG